MARQLRFSGTDSKVDGCPALHTDEGTGEIIVQGTPVTDPEDLAQLQHYGPDDAAVAVPRELLVNWGPKEMDRVPEMVDRDTFRRLFTTFEHTAWRLETRRGYASDRQDPDFQAFLATGSSPCDPEEPWFLNIRTQTDAGKTVGRVRIADNPPTTEQRFLLDYARHNTAVGEDIRYLWREDADQATLPAEDFWIFDSRIVALLRFDDEDTMLDIELITEPAQVVRYATIRDAAMHHAVPYDRFAAQVAATG
ncbi:MULTISPECIES: DUF6879 family protein [Streptomyces]|uniref:DUF6879 family protein n=1 Tax=Streptomyces TaxID=1883 RepID=UPI000CD4B04D|nr:MULTISPECIES: DUF6879 family protein [Streptomyces]AWL38998.1 hypothetical protein B9S64_13405 [Streptomyces sp. SM18]MBW5249811.1 hypothetical protein [Streptomyces poriferorum]MBW5257722.1 hypothetical protein [Streptomyces poriferorum]WSV69701.1 hypothetical protein OG623_20075 [Streptomyces sp. NBC_01012]